MAIIPLNVIIYKFSIIILRHKRTCIQSAMQWESTERLSGCQRTHAERWQTSGWRWVSISSTVVRLLPLAVSIVSVCLVWTKASWISSKFHFWPDLRRQPVSLFKKQISACISTTTWSHGCSLMPCDPTKCPPPQWRKGSDMKCCNLYIWGYWSLNKRPCEQTVRLQLASLLHDKFLLPSIKMVLFFPLFTQGCLFSWTQSTLNGLPLVCEHKMGLISSLKRQGKWEDISPLQGIHNPEMETKKKKFSNIKNK